MGGADHADVLGVFNGLDAFMAGRALLNLDFQSMAVMAVDTGGVTIDMIEFLVIHFAIVFISAMDFGLPYSVAAAAK